MNKVLEMKNPNRKKSPERTLAMVLAGGIGSFFMVLFFPKGVKYFFKNWFAFLVRDIVIVSLTGLITQKLADIFSQRARAAQQPPR